MAHTNLHMLMAMSKITLTPSEYDSWMKTVMEGGHLGKVLENTARSSDVITIPNQGPRASFRRMLTTAIAVDAQTQDEAGGIACRPQ